MQQRVVPEQAQRVYAPFSPGELDEMDEWGFRNRIRERSQVIRRLALRGLEAMRAESASTKPASAGRPATGEA